MNITAANLQDWLARDSIGYDMLDRLMPNTVQKYPPHNIVMLSEDRYQLTLAVAGFSKQDLTVEVNNGYLNVSGAQRKDDVTIKKVIHQGISSRDFERSWKLGEYVEITGVTLKDGLLTIELDRVIPETLKVRKIDIK